VGVSGRRRRDRALSHEYFEIAALDGETDYKPRPGRRRPVHRHELRRRWRRRRRYEQTASSSHEVSERGRANVLASILAAINQIMKDVPGSSAVRSDGSGRIAVTTTKETMSKVRDFVRVENESLLRQCAGAVRHLQRHAQRGRRARDRVERGS
jgi:hypothetical protein